MKNLKVSWKLFISYAVLLVLLVAGCAVSIAHLAGLGRQIETFYEGPFIVNDSANIVNSNFERMQKAVYRAIANSDPEITAEAIANARDSAAIIQEQLPVIKEHFLGDKDIIARLEAALTELEPMRKNVLELATLNRREEAADYMEHNNILVIKKAQGRAGASDRKRKDQGEQPGGWLKKQAEEGCCHTVFTWKHQRGCQHRFWYIHNTRYYAAGSPAGKSRP